MSEKDQPAQSELSECITEDSLDNADAGVQTWLTELPDDAQQFEPALGNGAEPQSSKKCESNEDLDVISLASSITSFDSADTSKFSGVEQTLRSLGVILSYGNNHYEYGNFSKAAKRMEDFQMHEDILPRTAESLLRPLVEKQKMNFDEDSWYDSGGQELDDLTDAKLVLRAYEAGRRGPIYRDMFNFTERAMRPMLDAAFPQCSGVNCLNLTRTRIKRRFQFHCVRGDMKILDFGLWLEPSIDEEFAFWDVTNKAKLMNKADLDTRHIAPCTLRMDIKAPMAVGVTCEWNPSLGQVQQAVWTLAQLKVWRALGLTKPFEQDLFFPMISVSGPIWELMIMECRKGDNGDKILHHGGRIGDLCSLGGSFQLLASLRELARWVKEEHRAWYRENILGLPASWAESEQGSEDSIG